jgi:aryl-alcohol dehydrogenase-like predicted oxidoreductase
MSNQGFGCMGFSQAYTGSKNTTTEKAKKVIHRAVESGVTLINSACFYGDLNEIGYGANLRLLNGCIEGLDRSKIQLMVKVGMDTRYVV